jgi:lipopolysaccharide/colanic/teichoic acid biosynthesis glycosyltransferase
VGTASSVGTLGDLPVLHVRAQRAGDFSRAAKRVADFVIATTLLALASPVMVLVALVVAASDGRPVIYRQRRVGRAGKEFDIWKFRTMVRDADNQDMESIAGVHEGAMSFQDAVMALKPEADPRLTSLGSFLRTSSLDELPQLWNVVRGDMSLVGPRPLRPFEDDSLSAWQLARRDVRPGITGLWQVRGRSSVLWDQRMQFDYTYIRHWTLASDLRILAETVPAVVRRRGAR